MAPRRNLWLGPAIFATCACTGGGAHITNDLRHLQRTAPIDAAAVDAVEQLASKNAENVQQVSWNSLPARVLCVRTRGGAVVKTPGSTDYSSTLSGQSKPSWAEDKKTHQMRPVSSKRITSFVSGNRATEPGSKKTLSPTKTFRSYAERVTTSFSESLSSGRRVIVSTLPATFFSGKLGTMEGQVKMKPPPDPKLKSAPERGSEEKKKAKTFAKQNKKVSVASTPASSVSEAAVKRRGEGAGGMELFLQALVPNSPYVCAAGIVALAVLGSGGLYALSVNSLLRSGWPTPPLDFWQVLTALAWAVNMKATFIGGRLDSSINRVRTAAFRPVSFFSPASWAFAIWAPIFLGEALFVVFQLLPIHSTRESLWLSEISPWFTGAMLFQTLWCASFRPWAEDAGLLWLPALLLGGTAIALGGVHGVLREAWFARDIELPQYLAAHLPLSIHFGWISCASLVSLNGYFGSLPRLSNRFKLAASVCSVLAAVMLAVGVTFTREDPVYAAVVAWALLAVGSESGWKNLKGRVDTDAIRTQEIAAKAGSVIALVAAGLLLSVTLKDFLLGGGAGDAYGDDS